MKESEFLEGISFNSRQDFIREFKPTKWSIRKFMDFIEDWGSETKLQFADHTIEMLKAFQRNDKDTLNFIRQIEEKKKKGFGYFPKSRVILLPVGNTCEQRLIKFLCMMQSDGLFEGTGKDLSIVIRDTFGVKLSLSTITGLVYECKGEFKKNLHSETFKKFRKLCQILK